MRTTCGALIGLALLVLAPSASAWETITVSSPFGSVRPAGGGGSTRERVKPNLTLITSGLGVRVWGPNLGVVRGSAFVITATPAPDELTVLFGDERVVTERLAADTYRVKVPVTLVLPTAVDVFYRRDREAYGRDSTAMMHIVPLPDAPRLR